MDGDSSFGRYAQLGPLRYAQFEPLSLAQYYRYLQPILQILKIISLPHLQ